MTAPADGPDGPAVLVVEDEAIAALALSHLLADLGCEVIGVTGSGEEALELARRRPPELVIMDVRLQGELNGIETASALRSWLEATVVFTSAYSPEELRKWGEIADPVHFVTKPVTHAELKRIVEAVRRGR